MLNEKLNLIEGNSPQRDDNKYVLGSVRMVYHEQFHDT